MFAQPMPQPLLHGSWQLQDKMHQTQGLEDFKIVSGIRDNMGATATKLGKGQRVTRLVRKTSAGLRVSTQMVETLAQDHRGNIKHDLTVARCTALLELPPATFPLFIILLNFWSLFLMTHDPCPLEPLLRCAQDDVVQGLLLAVPGANHTSIEGHLTRLPEVRHTLDQGNVLMVSCGVWLPGILQVGYLHRFVIRQHRRFPWHTHVDVALWLQPGHRCAIHTAPIFQDHIARAQHGCGLKKQTTSGQIGHVNRAQAHRRDQTRMVQQGP